MISPLSGGSYPSLDGYYDKTAKENQPGGKNAAAEPGAKTGNAPAQKADAGDKNAQKSAATGKAEGKDSKVELSAEEQKQVRALAQRDQEVRAHEAAHVAAGGQYIRGSASYSYTTGPDGKQYAVGGEVGIDSSPISDDPNATIQKMNVVIKAALAPAQPSGADLQVASGASRNQAQARADLAAKRVEELKGGDKKDEEEPEEAKEAKPEDAKSKVKLPGEKEEELQGYKPLLPPEEEEPEPVAQKEELEFVPVGLQKQEEAQFAPVGFQKQEEVFTPVIGTGKGEEPTPLPGVSLGASDILGLVATKNASKTGSVEIKIPGTQRLSPIEDENLPGVKNPDYALPLERNSATGYNAKGRISVSFNNRSPSVDFRA